MTVAQATGFQHGGGITMVVDYSGPDTNGRRLRCPSVEAVIPAALPVSEWTVQVFKADFGLTVSHALSYISHRHMHTFTREGQ
jgi:hypothetical protein